MAVQGRFDQVKADANWLCVAADTKPTLAQGAKDGDTLRVTDSKAIFVMHSGSWVQTSA